MYLLNSTAPLQVKHVTKVVSPDEYDQAVCCDPLASIHAATGAHEGVSSSAISAIGLIAARQARCSALVPLGAARACCISCAADDSLSRVRNR